MKLKYLYERFEVMPQLATHMLRVGGIVSLITNDTKAINTALVHDLGNIVKFTNLDPVWSQVQKKYQEKYSTDAHLATSMMLKEAGLIELQELVDDESNFFKRRMEIVDYSKEKLSSVLTLYADSRVAISGVVSMEERIVDLETRYKNFRDDRVWGPKLEQYVASITKRDVTKISEQDVVPLFDKLLTIDV